MAVYFIITNLRFAAMLRRSRRETEIKDAILPVYISAAIPTPCLFGFFSPAVYLTPQCENDAATMEHVLAHELTHYRHGDNIWAILRCAALALHWYNPLVWWAAILSKRDGELACDEGAIKRLGENERAPYGRTLIGMTCQRRDISSLAHTATTMTGSAKSIKERIILIAKKPKMAVYTLVAVVIIASVAVLCTFSGANRGFTDAEAKKMAKPLAESVAFTNGLELGNKPEIVRYEGEGAEADPDTKLKYVKLIYPTKNNTKEIVVEFCMTDGKGQHYDEPFSVVSRLSMNLSQVVPGTSSSVDYVQLWKKNYPNPVVPDEYKEKLKEFVTNFWYGEEYTQATPDDATLNTEGFTVYLKNGSSVTFGLDYVEHEGVYYHLSYPELPEWLKTAFYEREIRLQEYLDIGISIDEELLDYENKVLTTAAEVISEDIAFIEEARLLDISHISTGTATNTHSIDIYELEYRLRPDKPENITIANTEFEDGWLINGSYGMKYIILLSTGIGTWEHIATLTDYDMDAYRANAFYDNEYAAACIETYEGYMASLREKIVFYDGVGDGMPVYILDAVRHQAVREKDEFEAFCSGIEQVEVAAIEPMELGTLTLDKTGNQMYRLEFRLKVSDPDTVVLAGGVKYADGWFTEERYLVCELYEGEFSTNIRIFRYLTIQENYSLPQYIEAYGNMFTAACAEAFNLDAEVLSLPANRAIAMVGTNVPIGCYLYEKNRRIWTGEDWLYADGLPLASLLEEPYISRIPTESYSPGLGTSAGYGRISSLTVYDENMEPVYTDIYEDRRGTKALRWLESGTYYCVFGVRGKPGEYIPEAGGSEYINYDAVFRLKVGDDIFTNLGDFDPKNTGEIKEIYYYGGDYSTLYFNEKEIIDAICNALSTAEEMGYVGDCFFDDALYLVGENSTVAVCISGDSCRSIYSDGKCWIISNEGMELIKALIQEKQNDMGYVVQLQGKPEQVLDVYANKKFPSMFLENKLGGIVQFENFELISCKIVSREVKGDRFQGRIEFAMKPDNANLAAHLISGSYKMGDGKYSDWVVGTKYFLFEKLDTDVWQMTRETTGSIEWGEYPDNLTDEEALSIMLDALENDSEFDYLKLLPTFSPKLLPKGEENYDIYLDFFNSIVDYAIGDYQLTRNLYIMKGAQLSDGALAEQYSIALRMLYEYDFGSYAAALSFLDEEERENVDMLLEYAMSYYE